MVGFSVRAAVLVPLDTVVEEGEGEPTGRWRCRVCGSEVDEGEGEPAVLFAVYNFDSFTKCLGKWSALPTMDTRAKLARFASTSTLPRCDLSFFFPAPCRILIAFRWRCCLSVGVGDPAGGSIQADLVFLMGAAAGRDIVVRFSVRAAVFRWILLFWSGLATVRES